MRYRDPTDNRRRRGKKHQNSRLARGPTQPGRAGDEIEAEGRGRRREDGGGGKSAPQERSHGDEGTRGVQERWRRREGSAPQEGRRLAKGREDGGEGTRAVQGGWRRRDARCREDGGGGRREDGAVLTRGRSLLEVGAYSRA